MRKVIIDGKAVNANQTKTALNPMAPTPLWAKWVFRVFALLTLAASFIVASDPGIPDEIKVRIIVYLKGADMLVLGLSKLAGVEIKDGKS